MNVWQRLGGWLFSGQEDRRDSVVAAYQVEHMLASLLTMAWIVEARDPYTGGHLWRVSRYARLLAEKIGLDDAEAAMISLGGFLHDLGKIGIPDAILRKPDRLTAEEYAIMKTHPEIGVRMLAGHPLADWVREAVKLHHERPDGQGYPRGLRGDAIPEAARIIGICDAFDAMTSHRPYRRGMSKAQALTQIRQGLGTQFDGIFGMHFLQLAETGILDNIMGFCDEGIPLQCCPMCGPTLAVKRTTRPGEHLYCPNCTGQFVLTPDRQTAPTGGHGRPEDMEPDPDHELIARTVRHVVLNLPVARLLQVSRPQGNHHV